MIEIITDKRSRRIEYERRYRNEHREQEREKSRRYRAKHLDEINEHQRKYRAENKGKRSKYLKIYRLEHKDTRRADARLEIIVMLGGKCTRCGFDDVRALQVDHVNGNGNKQRKRLGNSIYMIMLEDIKNGSQEYQILCANCNWIKRYEKNERS